MRTVRHTSHLLIISFSNLQCHQGTPIFIARAVELGRAVEPPLGEFVIPAVPKSPAAYSFNHPDRIKRFPVARFQTVEIGACLLLSSSVLFLLSCW
jgi:hypothetical protein